MHLAKPFRSGIDLGNLAYDDDDDLKEDDIRGCGEPETGGQGREWLTRGGGAATAVDKGGRG